MFPVACKCNGWAKECKYCGGSGWVMLAPVREGK